jgi:hypothetical protein
MQKISKLHQWFGKQNPCKISVGYIKKGRLSAFLRDMARQLVGLIL